MIRASVSAALGLALAVLTLASSADGAERALTYNGSLAAGRTMQLIPVASSSRRAMPDILVWDASNFPTHVGKFTGKVVVLNFYSILCGSCLKDLTTLNRLQGDIRNGSVMVIAVSLDANKTMADVKAFLKRQGLDNLKPYMDPSGASASTLGVSNLPSSVVIDKSGHVVEAVEGSVVWDSGNALQAIYALTRE